MVVYTSHYEPGRSFEETRSGLFDVRVAGDWLPRHVAQRLHIVCATARNLWLALRVGLSCRRHDAFVVDQLSACVPLLRLLCPRARVLFYCHHPDLLLATRGGLRELYRAPFDAAEEATTAMADAIVVNSRYTLAVFERTFRCIGRARAWRPGVLYPCISVEHNPALPPAPAAGDSGVTFLSINRFERKKGLALAVEALALAREALPGASLKLVMAGGYDERVAENVEHLRELQELVGERGLGDAVSFVCSFSDAQKVELMRAARAVVYTPVNEHFGIVPVEAGAAARAVIACNSGGPLESVVDGRTGFLCEPTPEAFAEAMARLAEPEGGAGAALAAKMGSAARAHVVDKFSREAFSTQLDGTVRALVADPPRRYVSWLTLATFTLLLLSASLLCVALLARAAGLLDDPVASAEAERAARIAAALRE